MPLGAHLRQVLVLGYQRKGISVMAQVTLKKSPSCMVDDEGSLNQ